MTDSKYIEDFLNYIQDAKASLPLEEAAQKYCEDKLQDLQHKLELERLDYNELACAAMAISNVRKERRNAKDRVELLTPIVVYCENNKRFFDTLAQLLGEVRKIEKRHDNRTYLPKVQEWKG